MAKVTIADLDAAGALDGTELVEIEQGGESKQTTTQDIADLGGGGAGYLVYTALLTQSGTDAPVATVLENTLGGTVVWSYDDVGYYIGTLAGVFTENKTFALIGLQPSGGAGSSAGISRTDNNSVYLVNYDEARAAANEFDFMSLEIRVYP